MNQFKFKNQYYPAIFSIALLLFFLFSFLFMPNDPNDTNLALRLQSGSELFPLGTDTLGRCVLSRLMLGGRTTLLITITSSSIVLIFGSLFGLLIGYYKSKYSWIFEMLLDAFTAFPSIVYLIIFIGAWGGGFFTLLFAISISNIAKIIKFVKTHAETEKSKSYLYSAIVSGASHKRIMLYHIYPNIFSQIIVYLCLMCAEIILLVASFSYFGIGLSGLNWGAMIADAKGISIIRPELMIYPAICIVLVTLAFNSLGEKGVNDA